MIHPTPLNDAYMMIGSSVLHYGGRARVAIDDGTGAGEHQWIASDTVRRRGVEGVVVGVVRQSVVRVLRVGGHRLRQHILRRHGHILRTVLGGRGGRLRRLVLGNGVGVGLCLAHSVTTSALFIADSRHNANIVEQRTAARTVATTGNH